ncbi:MAG TPA: RecT family recombinase [Desulfatiglandales bacterium]|nr:RecT family recombinase [Desulfatiglandales bacterium]
MLIRKIDLAFAENKRLNKPRKKFKSSLNKYANSFDTSIGYVEYNYQLERGIDRKQKDICFFERGNGGVKTLRNVVYMSVKYEGIYEAFNELGMQVPGDREWSKEEIDSVCTKIDSDKKFKLTPYYRSITRGDIEMAMNDMIQNRRGNNIGTALMQAPAVDGWTHDQVALIKKTVAPGASDDELKMFLGVSAKYKLDPLAREIFFWKDQKGKICIFTGIDGWKKAGMQDPNYAGLKSGVVKEGDVFLMDVEAGTVDHKITGKRGGILGAWGIAYHKDPARPPAIEWCDLGDYKKTIGAWLTNPSDMIKKTAETHALRKQFSLTGLDFRTDISEEERYSAIRGQLMEPRISPEEKIHRVRICKLIRSFHSIGVTDKMIEQYLQMPVSDMGDAEIDEMSEIGMQLISGIGTWAELTAPFGTEIINIQLSEATPEAEQEEHRQQQCKDNLPFLDDQPWAGERAGRQIKTDEHATSPVGNGKEKLARIKIMAKLVAVFPKDTEAQEAWLNDKFTTSIGELDMLNMETLQSILDGVEILFSDKVNQQRIPSMEP